jgi:hypothetical protein
MPQAATSSLSIRGKARRPRRGGSAVPVRSCRLSSVLAPPRLIHHSLINGIGQFAALCIVEELSTCV